MKKLWSIILATTLCLTLNLSAAAAPVNETASFNLNQNAEYTAAFNGQAIQPLNTEQAIPSVNISFGNFENEIVTATVSLAMNGVQESVNLVGSATRVVAEAESGYVAKLDGNVNGTPVIADVIVADCGDCVTILTLGTLSETSLPQTYAFGDYTAAIATVSTKYANSLLIAQAEQARLKNIADTKIAAAGVDATVKYQDHDTIKAGSLEIARLSLFAATESRNGSYTTVRAKFNTNSQNFIKYMRNTKGVIAMYPGISEANILMEAQSDYFHASKAECQPNESASEKVTLYVPYVSGGAVEIVGIPFQVSRVSLNFDSFSSDSQFDTNSVEWTIQRTGGLSMDETDGDQYTSTGLPVKTQFQYEGSNATPIDVDFNVSGNMEISYGVPTDTSITILHMTTSYAEVPYTYSIQP